MIVMHYWGFSRNHHANSLQKRKKNTCWKKRYKRLKTIKQLLKMVMIERVYTESTI